MGKTVIDHDTLREEINAVGLPSQDPVNGVDGPLLTLWAAN